MSRKEEKKISRGNGNSGLMNVARKEFSDHLQSKKLLIIFALFFLISAYSLHVGIEDYQRSLERYKDHIVRIEEVEAEHGVGTGWMLERPSPLLAFVLMSIAMGFLGPVLAIAMGFDVVTKEKQQRTLKTLLSHPVYRDEIINGKAIGGIAALGVAIGVTFAISVAMLLIFGIVPTLSEFVSIILFGILSVVFLISYFAIALMSSTLSKDSGLAIISAFVIVLIIALILPTGGHFVADHIVGPPPEMPEIHWIPEPAVDGEIGESVPVPVHEPFAFHEDEEWRQWREASRAHWDRKKTIAAMFSMLNPAHHFGEITGVLGVGMGLGSMPMPMGGIGVDDPDQDIDFVEKLERIWMNILGLIVIPAIFFAVAYTRFMKMDVR